MLPESGPWARLVPAWEQVRWRVSALLAAVMPVSPQSLRAEPERPERASWPRLPGRAEEEELHPFCSQRPEGPCPRTEGAFCSRLKAALSALFWTGETVRPKARGAS